MKANSILAFLFLLVAGMQTTWGQGFRVYKSDGTVAQFSLRTDSIVFYDGIGSDQDFGPFTPVNQCIAGTWYKSKSETITFREDGTTDYMAGATYKFLPYQGTIVIFNTGGVPTNILKVHDVTAEHLIMSTLGSSTFDVLTRTKPVQLVEGITLSKTQFTLSINETQTLTATVSPSDADNKEVEWTSSDASIASVDQSGKVTAKAKGTCTITCAATDGSGMKAECAVTVVQLVTGITLSETTLSLTTGSTHTLTATVVPPTASNTGVAWKSSNTSVATVDQSGNVTAKAKGTCTITCSAKDGSGMKAECAVTVIQLVTGITLSETSITLYPDETKRLTATVVPSNANNPAVTWTSSDDAVATVISNGLVVAVASGTCTIICAATDGSGVKAECQVTVATPATGITLNQTSLSLEVGTTQKLTATVQPSDATNKAVTWTSSNKSIATVSTSGKVTAVAPGECTVTATAKDGSGVKAECQVTVVQPVTSITLSHATLTLEPEKSQTLTATVQPTDATNKAVTWTSSNASIATVSTSGEVKAIAPGECTITCAAADGSGVKAECQVTVKNDNSGTIDGRDYVDLGLPSGTLWATCNVGASKPEEYGDFLSWGETDSYWRSYYGVEDYSWSNYPYCNGSGYQITKYCDDDSRGFNGFKDFLTELLPEDDAATVKWGSDWQMPSKNQIEELINSSHTTTEWTQVNGVNGYKITSKTNSNSIFLPDAAHWYWSRSLYEHGSDFAYCIKITSDDVCCDFLARSDGLSVRPVRVLVSTPQYNNHEWIDLGLPSGTFWATCNVGASKPEEYGEYFAWGETEPKSTSTYNYNWSTYKFCMGTDNTITLYRNGGGDYCFNFNGFTDSLTELLPAHDAATVNWGSGWQMPSEDQINELIDSSYTTSEYIQLNGVNGYKITSKSNGNSIFLPAAGYTELNGYDYIDKGGYWSRSLWTGDIRLASWLFFYSDGIDTGFPADRCYGKSVRPVRVD